MKFSFLRFLIPAIIILCIDLYTFQAVKTVTQNLSATGRRTVHIIFWTITTLTLATLAATLFTDFFSWNKYIRNFWVAPLLLLLLCKILIIPFLLVDDLVRLGRWIAQTMSKSPETVEPHAPGIKRSEFISQLALIIAGIPFMSLIYGIIYGAYDYKVRRYTMRFSNLPASFNGLRILQISDLHVGSFVETHHLEKAIDIVNAQKPDIIFFTGDLVNNETKEVEPFMEALSRIKAPMGVYSSLGNHDYGDYKHWESHAEKVENLQQLFDTHKQLGWNLLRNENRIIRRGNDSIAIAGSENWSKSNRFPKYGDLHRSMKGLDEAPFVILMSHDPSHWDAQVVGYPKKIDLMLAGHTHGMQFGVDTKWLKWSPSQYFYKEWAGLYKQGDRFLYVNRGLGFLGYPGRAGIRPEITVIELRTA
jgi:predicted MPP superfamily phosphohydrolase